MAGSDVSKGVLDPGQIWERVDGDAELLCSLIEIYRSDAARLLAEIKAAIMASNAIALERASHTLKGSTSIFAANGAVQIASTLEQLGHTAIFDSASTAHARMVVAVNDVLAALVAVLAHGPP